MDYVALKLSEKTLEEKKTLATNLAAALVTNAATYATPNPATTVLTAKVAEITAKQTLLDAAQAVLDGHTADLRQLEADLDAELTAEAAYIQQTSGGVASKITLLGLALKGHVSPITPPGPVLDLKLSAGENAGEVKTACKPASGAVSYLYQWTLDPTKPETWAMKDTSPGCRHTLTDFTSGAKVWLRVCAVGGKNTGKGPWSDPAGVTVP
jgi:hypothetical protein